MPDLRQVEMVLLTSLDKAIQGNLALEPWVGEVIFDGGFLSDIWIVVLWVFISNTVLNLLSLFLPSMSDATLDQPTTLLWPPPVQVDAQESGHAVSEVRMR